MSGTVLNDTGAVWMTGNHTLADPGSGGTIQQHGVAYGLVKIASGTRVLPDNGLPIYVQSTSGTTTINSAAGVTVGEVLNGSIQLFMPLTSTTWTLMPGNVPATDVIIQDSGTYFSSAGSNVNLENAVANLAQCTKRFSVPLTSFTDADGDPLAKFADNASPNPGWNLANSEAFGIRWNNNATQNQPVLAGGILLPPDLTSESGLTLNVLASKTGATVGDATTFTAAIYAQEKDALHDAWSNIGGATSAMTGNATAKTVQHETLAVSLAGLVAHPVCLTMTITPTSGTLGTDDVIIHAIWFTYDALA